MFSFLFGKKKETSSDLTSIPNDEKSRNESIGVTETPPISKSPQLTIETVDSGDISTDMNETEPSDLIKLQEMLFGKLGSLPPVSIDKVKTWKKLFNESNILDSDCLKGTHENVSFRDFRNQTHEEFLPKSKIALCHNKRYLGNESEQVSTKKKKQKLSNCQNLLVDDENVTTPSLTTLNRLRKERELMKVQNSLSIARMKELMQFKEEEENLKGNVDFSVELFVKGKHGYSMFMKN
ncbi:hypothetical protein HDU92_008980 [Lobulomyces angularis]|nr:hypothetical protein HDU92_008980 [Lobulomyces angularis]